MATYYVFIPASDMPTAEVTATNTKHARTAYLDYLTRSGRFPYSQRSSIREAIATKRVDPGEYPTDLKLEYGVQEPLESGVEEVFTPQRGYTPEQTEYLMKTTGITPHEMTPEEYEEEAYNQPEQQPANPFSNSPIMNLSKKTGGM